MRCMNNYINALYTKFREMLWKRTSALTYFRRVFMTLHFTGINTKSVTSHLNNANCNRVLYSSSRECVELYSTSILKT